MTTIVHEVKEVLLEELGNLSYAEKRRVRDALDANFINAELRQIEKRKKFPILLGLFQASLVAQAMFIAVTPDTRQIRAVLFVRVLAGLFGAFMAGIEFGKLDKRRAIYRIFSRLASSKQAQ